MTEQTQQTQQQNNEEEKEVVIEIVVDEQEQKKKEKKEKERQKKEQKKKEAEKEIDERELYFIDFSSLNNLKKKQVVKALERKLTHISKSIIGKGSAISIRELFISVYGMEPEFFDMFKASYLLQILKKIIRKMRADKKIYFIMTKYRIFVLQSIEEAENWKGKLDDGINGLQKLKTFADEWVGKEMWKMIDKQ